MKRNYHLLSTCGVAEKTQDLESDSPDAESRLHSVASLNLGSQLNVEMMTPAFRVVAGLKGGVKV